jgi:hypothetical protein
MSQQTQEPNQMNRPITAVAAAAAVAVAIGLYAPAATAAPAGKPHATTHAKPHAKPRVSKDARRLAAEKTVVLREIAHKDAGLAVVLKNPWLSRLDATQAGTVRANVAADRATLATLKSGVSAATTVTDVRALRAKVKQVRPEVYYVAINTVRQAARFLSAAARNTATIAALTTQADAKEADGFDVTAVRTELDAAAVANTEAGTAAAGATDLALGLTATATHAGLDGVRTRLAVAEAALTTAADHLAAAESAVAAMVAPEPAA